MIEVNRPRVQASPSGLKLATLSVAILSSCVLVGCGDLAAGPGRAAGQEADGPWWITQTAISRDGKIDLKSKPWWPQAAGLKAGEQFTLSDEQGGPMLVRREALTRGARKFEAIVWIIDDDGDGSVQSGGDTDSDCYVVDWNCDGTVDRMVDYIDNDGDNDPDEMDIRYFEGGELRSVWCGSDLDDDTTMWDLEAYEYSHNFFKSDPYGNEMIYMNKFDPVRGEWVPISECPFSFYDTDDDGYSEVVVRISASPLAFDPSVDPDYANDAGRYRGQWNSDMERMGVSNIRYSFDVDNLSGEKYPLHYEFGFNLVGSEPYDVGGMKQYNPRRRPPQVTCVIPHDKLRRFSDHYPARETGFTWHENHDDTIEIGDAPDPKLDFRWEGVFWIWERRFMENTGGPGQKWNVRREWSRKPSSSRDLYYSPVDGRLHLYGAAEGWIQIGHFAGLGEIGEVRTYDTDDNGFFDRWEVYLGDSPVPVRVSSIRDDVQPRIRFDYDTVCKLVNEKAIPEAMSANQRLTEAMAKIKLFAAPEALARATKEGTPNECRYAQDVALELRYQDLRQSLSRKANEILRQAKMNDIRTLNAEQRAASANSQTAWQMIRLLQFLDVAYGRGDVGEAVAILSKMETIKNIFD
jgi:hypothetical protein